MSTLYRYYKRHKKGYKMLNIIEEKIQEFNTNNANPEYRFMETGDLDYLYQKHYDQFVLGNGASESVVEMKLFNPVGMGTWLICEMDEYGICFGAVDLGYGFEMGSFDLLEVMNLKLTWGMRVERDIHYSKGKLLTEAIKGTDYAE